MKHVIALLAVLAALPLPAQAQGCPPLADRAEEKADLYARLAASASELAAQATASALWRLWMQAPDARAQDLLDRAIERREAYDFAAAEALLDELVGYCPDFPEAWNQRAFARFLREDYDGALADIDEVLAREPSHFGAMSGQALALMRQGRMGLGQQALRSALKVHPFLAERSMLLPQKDI